MKKTIFATVLTAFGATLCCTGPVLVLLFGSTAIGMFTFFEPIRPYASILALGILGFAYYKAFEKPTDEHCCEADKEEAMRKEKTQKRILLGVTPIVLALLLFPYYSGMLYGGSDDITVDREKQGTVSEWTIEGMICGGCAVGLQSGMGAVEGVIQCTVDYKSKTLVCNTDDNVLKTDAIPGLVEQMGYKAILKEDQTSDKKMKPSKI